MIARSLEALEAPPADYYDPGVHDPYEGEVRQMHEAKAAPFLQAFEAGKEERRETLRRKRENLEAGPVVVSTFNWGFRCLVENWAASCDHHGIDCRAFTLLFPMDEGADQFARQLGFETFFDRGSYGELPTEASRFFGDENFRKCLFAKLAMTQDMLETGADILRQDVDMVWLRDPRRELTARIDREFLDFLFMDDGRNPLHKPLYYNSGFVHLRNNPFTRYAWNLVFSNYARVIYYGGEQRLINMVINFLRDRGLRSDRLPADVFVNGNIIARALNEDKPLPDSTAVIHASWTKNLEHKLKILKQLGHWYV